jgi:histone H1/5
LLKNFQWRWLKKPQQRLLPRPRREKTPKAPATHLPVSNIVTAAIKSLKERGGSSLQAIKKYLAATYKVDCEKLAPFIKKFLKNAVADGKLLQTKGREEKGRQAKGKNSCQETSRL